MRMTRSLSSIDASIRKSLYDSVIQHILELAKFPKSIPVVYGEELNNILQPGSETGEQSDVVIGSDRRVKVDVEEMRSQAGKHSRHLSGHIEEYIYHEPRYGIYIYPIVAEYETTFNLQFRSHSKSEIVNVMNGLIIRQDGGNHSFMTGGEYFYYIPKEMFSVIIDLYTVASVEDKELPEMSDYLLSNLAEWVTVTMDQSGKQGQFTARREVSGIQLIITSEDLKTDKNDKYYTIDINVKFTHERPTDIQVEFPLYATGVALPEQYHPQNDSPWIVERTGHKNGLIESADDIVSDVYFTYPYLYTGEFIGGVGSNVAQLFASDICPSVGNTKLLSIYELPFGFTGATIDYLRDMQRQDPSMVNSVIQLGLYIDGVRVEGKYTYCDQSLSYHTSVDIKVHRRHQIAIECIREFNETNMGMLDSMRTHPRFFREFVQAFYPYMEVCTEEELVDKVTVPIKELDDFAESTIKNKSLSSGLKTVHVGSIIVMPTEGE